MCNKLLLIGYGLIANCLILSADQQTLKTLTSLAPISASYFAEDPRRLNEFIAANPDFGKLPYTKCVVAGFNNHPELSQPATTLEKSMYNLGFSPTLKSHRAYFDALHIQFKCMKPIIAKLQ